MSRSVRSDDLRESLSERAHEAAERVGRTAGKGGARIRREAADMEERTRDAGQKVKESSDDALEVISVFVRENPMAALGLAFAAGALLSGLRRRS